MFSSSAPKCGRCGKSVYKAEERIGAGKKWHAKCFRCKTCGKGLDSTTLADDGAGEIFCKVCHAKLKGPVGYGFGGGAGVMHRTQKEDPVAAAPQASGNKCGKCGFSPLSGKFCSSCGAPAAAAAASAAASEQKSSAHAAAAPPQGSVSRNPFKQNAASSGAAPKFGGAPKCGRCGKSVYKAEERIGAGKKWHAKCFRCKTCGKGLDSTTLVDDAEGNIMCRNCHAAEKGPKGFGFGQSTMHTQ